MPAKIPHEQLNIYLWQPDKMVDKTPIVLLHDSLGCVALWRDFPQILANTLQREVIAYDRLGFGQSASFDTKPGSDFINREADRYFPMVKQAAKLTQYILLGHSVGGAMAIAIAALDKDCKAVITLAAQAFVEDLTLNGIKTAQKHFADPNQVARLAKYHGDKAQWVLNAWIDVWLSDDFADWSLASCIADVSCPVLAIHGDKDEYGSKAFMEFIAGNTSGYGEMVLLEDCGHVPHNQKSKEVLALIENMLANRL